MKQSHLESLLEACLNIGSGFLISWALWLWVVAPLFDIQTQPREGLLITSLFTLASLVRSYLWRRFFNAGLHQIFQTLPSANDWS